MPIGSIPPCCTNFTGKQMSLATYSPTESTIATRVAWEKEFLNATTMHSRWLVLQQVLDHVDIIKELRFYDEEKITNLRKGTIMEDHT